MTALLPFNATTQERALAETVGTIGDLPVPVRDVWDVDTCPPDLLAWLAWAFSVDEWDSNWTPTQQREFIKRSVSIHRKKGTIGAVKEALGALLITARIQEWFNQTPAAEPYTFRILLEADQIGIDQAALRALFDLVNRTKNLRSHLTEVELTMRSVAGPRVAAVAGIGSEITVSHFRWPLTVINEHVLVI